MGAELTASQACPHCHESSGGHQTDCPMGNVLFIKMGINHYRCPSCGRDEIDTNAASKYECRNCHAQFDASSRGRARTDCPQVTLVIDGENKPAAQLPEKGEGHFPKKKRLQEAEAALARAETALAGGGERGDGPTAT